MDHFQRPASNTDSDPLAEVLGKRIDLARNPLELREFLDPMAAQYAAIHATQSDLKALEQAVAQIGDAADEKTAAQADWSFHKAIYEASQNDTLIHVSNHLQSAFHSDMGDTRKRLGSGRQAKQIMIDQHKAILGAIVANDPLRAAEAASDHIRFIMKMRSGPANSPTNNDTSTSPAGPNGPKD